MKKDDKWIIDSCYLHHMTSDKNKFKTFEYYGGNNIKFWNDAPCPVKGKGSIVLIDKITCKNTYFVEVLNYYLLSISQLNNSRYKVEFN